MPEIRAQLTDEIHRKLKAEAAHQGIPLKELVARIIKDYVSNETHQAGRAPKRGSK